MTILFLKWNPTQPHLWSPLTSPPSLLDTILSTYEYLDQKEQLEILIQNRDRVIKEKNSESISLARLAQDNANTLKNKSENIRALVENINFGIVIVEKNLRISNEHSPYLKNLFPCYDFSNEKFLDFATYVFGDYSSCYSAVESIMGESSLSFEMNKHHLIKEFCFKNKEISCDWIPLCDDDDNTVRMLLVIKDLTDIKNQRILEKRKKIQIQVLESVYEQKFWQVESLIELMKLADDELCRLHDQKKKPSAELLRRLHTIKGGAKTLNMNIVASDVHEIESILLANQQVLSNHWESLTETIEYFDTIKSKLSSEDDKVSLSDIIEPIEKNIASTAEKLNKPSPKIHFDNIVLPRDKEVHKCFMTLLTHAVNNSLDHGIESPSTRLTQNKSKQGNIYIRHKVTEIDYQSFYYYDDGQGLNIDKIKRRAVKDGLLAEINNNDQEIASLIFASSFSTADSLSDISGRGIGMDSIKSEIESLGGSITIDFTGPKQKGKRPFRFTIEIPIKPEREELSA